MKRFRFCAMDGDDDAGCGGDLTIQTALEFTLFVRQRAAAFRFASSGHINETPCSVIYTPGARCLSYLDCNCSTLADPLDAASFCDLGASRKSPKQRQADDVYCCFIHKRQAILKNTRHTLRVQVLAPGRAAAAPVSRDWGGAGGSTLPPTAMPAWAGGVGTAAPSGPAAISSSPTTSSTPVSSWSANLLPKFMMM